MRYKCVWEKKTTEKKWLYHVTFTSNKWLVNAMIYNIVFFRSPARKQSIRLWLDIPYVTRDHVEAIIHTTITNWEN